MRYTGSTFKDTGSISKDTGSTFKEYNSSFIRKYYRIIKRLGASTGLNIKAFKNNIYLAPYSYYNIIYF